MRRLSITLAICSLLIPSSGIAVSSPQKGAVVRVSDSIGEAYKRRSRDVQVRGEGVVSRTLSDDNSGSRHQRFIVQIASGLTILIAHNIDLAPRVPDLNKGDRVEFYGEYVWNDKGGTVHWTHHDPKGRHVAGWIKHKYKTYQ